MSSPSRTRKGSETVSIVSGSSPDGHGEGGQADRSPTEAQHQGIEDGLVDPVETEDVDLVQLQSRPGAGLAHDPVAVDLRPVADSAQEAVRDTRRAPASTGDLADSVAVDRHAEQACRPGDDHLEVGGVVEVEVGGEPEAVPQRTRQQAGTRRGTHQGERLDVERDRGRSRALPDDDVHAEVLHGEVQHLLGGARHPMDLVDEEDLTRLQARQDGCDVAGMLQRRPRGHAQGGAHLGGDDAGEGRLAQARRAAEQDVVGRAAAQAGGLKDEAQLRLHALLSDELGEVLRSQGAFDEGVVGIRLGVQRAVARHGRSSSRKAALSRAPTSGRPPAVAAATEAGSIC